jgi:sucrose phosphorylase
MEGVEDVKHILERIYGLKKGSEAFGKIFPLIKSLPTIKKREQQTYFSQEDVVLITYGDSLNRSGEAPLSTLHKFANIFFKDVFSTIHILPFFPFSSDDGFSVMDFFSVNPQLGTWSDINKLGVDFRLMFDHVLNHVSAKSRWFEKYLKGEEGFEDLAIEVEPSVDLSEVTRPRSLPLLTEFKKSSGNMVHLWTTFSADQIDLNYKSIDVLEKIVKTLLFYVKQGATIIRFDAIAYLWKEIGTNCIHLSQTHDMVKLFRKILDLVAPNVIILTETNVPHSENVSYFGDGQDEAQMVYNFTLPPLLFYSFAKEDSTVLSEWAKGLYIDSPSNTFFNFTASHDGIGVRPLEGILPKEEINRLIEIVKNNGGDVSFKKNSDGSKSPYELNITYIDALLKKKYIPDTYHTQRFLASQAIKLALPGVPAVYIHSILGSRNWNEGVRQMKSARTINREKLQIDTVLSQLKDPESFRSKIFEQYMELIKIRKKQSAFHPNADFEILEIDNRLFAIARYSKKQEIYAITNITSQTYSVSLSKDLVPSRMEDLITGKIIQTSSFRLNPYQYLWLNTTDI